MNDILEVLMTLAVLCLASTWITVVFCYVLFILGVHDE